MHTVVCGLALWLLGAQAQPPTSPPPAATPVPSAVHPERPSPPTLPAGRRLLIGRATSRVQGEPTWQVYLVHQEVILSDAQVDKATVATDEHSGQPVIHLSFDRFGAHLFEAFTRANIRRRLAIVLDDEVESAPVIQSAIPGGRALIALGGGKPLSQMKKEADWLATLLRTSSLPTPVRLEEEMTAPNGLRLVLSVDAKAAERRWLDEWAGAIQAGLAGAGVRIERFERSAAGYRLELADAKQAGLAASLLGWLPKAPHISIDRDKPGKLSISPAPDWRLDTRVSIWTRAVLARRMDELDLDGELKIEKDGRITVTLEGSPDMATVKSALLRRGRLEFVAVDDESTFMAAMADRLPPGISLETQTFYGEGQPTQSRYWQARGPEGRALLEALIRRISRP